MENEKDIKELCPNCRSVGTHVCQLQGGINHYTLRLGEIDETDLPFDQTQRAMCTQLVLLLEKIALNPKKSAAEVTKPGVYERRNAEPALPKPVLETSPKKSPYETIAYSTNSPRPTPIKNTPTPLPRFQPTEKPKPIPIPKESPLQKFKEDILGQLEPELRDIALVLMLEPKLENIEDMIEKFNELAEELVVGDEKTKKKIKHQVSKMCFWVYSYLKKQGSLK